jgi:5-aminolevulinate synthase
LQIFATLHWCEARSRAISRVSASGISSIHLLAGGYIAASAALVDFVRSHVPGFIFTSALPPSIAAGALASRRHVKSDPSLRARHQHRVVALKRRLASAGLPVMTSASHIVPVIVGNPVDCKAASDELLHRHGIYVQSINYPTLARGSERLRLTPSPPR